MGERKKSPFEGNPNGVPMLEICRKIERKVMDMRGEQGGGIEQAAEHSYGL
ncbi:hypothetical protein [Ralstonia sp. TCR112]|uniref:hypothetical protein n=1 Tax=Ralstonia sp. TCR112 TaxID=2601730 RepID=UPI00164CB284|nr:hypothetical protein [Ralstonia sp. TCR112]